MTIFVLTWLLLLMLSFEASSETFGLINATNLAKPGCKSRCGDLIVPYPFGIGLNCSIDPGFDVHCDTSLHPPKAYFAESFLISIKNISDSTLRTSNDVATRCYYPDGTIRSSYSVHTNYMNSQYTFSKLNKFTVVGCYDHAWLHSKSKSNNVSAGCTVFCDRADNILKGECSGSGCCQSSIPQDISVYRIKFQDSYFSDDTKNRPRPCTLAFVGENNTFTFNGATDLQDTKLRNRIRDHVPLVFDWAIGNTNCIKAKQMKGFACQSNSTCVNSTRETGGYRCKCKEGYEGNPYLPPGCQDIDECKDKEKYGCYGDCINIVGSYKCTCGKGYDGDAKRKDGCTKITIFWKSMFGVGIVIGIVVLRFTLWLFKEVRRWKDEKRREKFFKRNGGSLLLQQKPSGGGTGDDKPKIYREIDIVKATEQFREDTKVGQGSYGIVYKAVLGDKRIVAIKKCTLVDKSQVETFIDKVFILTQISSHSNVVKFLGCCLETEVPMLVYEFVPNKTLFDFLHDKDYELPPWLQMATMMWKTRLQMATEIAGALASLHLQSSTRIYHWDVKSSNMLLDQNYRAKLSDFGISKSVSEDQTQVSTSDPECDQSRDVYDFGIVLLELLTGKEPTFTTQSGENTDLATFILSMEDQQVVENVVNVENVEKAHLYNTFILENVDARVSDAPNEQVIALADLAKRCLNSNGKPRPNMKDVEAELKRYEQEWLN